MPIQNMLVATDIDRQSMHVLLRAIRLAQQSRATMHVLHVTRRQPQDDTPDAVAALQDEITTEIRDLINSHSASKNNHVVHVVSNGRVHERIEEYAHTVRADLIVLGRSARANVLPDSVFLTTGQVLARAAAPVLVVTQPVTGDYRHLVMEVELARFPAGLLQVMSAFGPDTRLTLLVGSAAATRNPGFLSRLLSPVRRRKQEAYIKKMHAHAREVGFDAKRVSVDFVPDDYETALLSKLADERIDLIGLTRMDATMRHRESGRHMIDAMQSAACDILVQPG